MLGLLACVTTLYVFIIVNIIGDINIIINKNMEEMQSLKGKGNAFPKCCGVSLV